MRVVLPCVVVLLVLASSFTARADYRDASKVNKILKYGTFVTPDLEPGTGGELSFDLYNPYNESMTDVMLNVSMYQYIEQEVSIKVDSNWGWEYPKFEGAPGGGRDKLFLYPPLAANTSVRVELVVLTSTDMPHGGIFNQGTYLVRFWLAFTLNTTSVRMASPGYWSKEQFRYATEEGEDCPPGNCIGQVNLSRLGGIGGILPDTAFGVKDRIPTWPFYALIVVAGFFAVLAFLFYAEENPATFPRSARAFARFKGRLARVFRPRRGKRPPRVY